MLRGALSGPCRHLQDLLFFFKMKIALKDPGCVFGVIVALQYKFGAIICLRDGTAWWISICLYFSALKTPLIPAKSPTPFAEMQSQICKEHPPTFTVFCRYQFASTTAKWFKSVQSTCCHFSAPQFQCSPPSGWCQCWTAEGSRAF